MGGRDEVGNEDILINVDCDDMVRCESIVM